MGMRAHADVLGKLLGKDEYGRARERYVRYLAAYKVVEQNLSLFDKMARSRDTSDLISAIYESMRVKDRVLASLEEGIRRGDYKLAFECDNVRAAFSVGHDDIEKILELAREDPKITGVVLATLALAYGGVQPVRR
ncbi:MAG: hypothetical protein DRJ67_03090 [Thermoprotei archaeon]|nr:MAG: hypothetical protein DRJ67_03090 [Thermoprotei archaeon]